MFPYNQLCYIRVGGVTNYDNLQMLEFETYNIQLCPSLLKQHNFKFFWNAAIDKACLWILNKKLDLTALRLA